MSELEENQIHKSDSEPLKEWATAAGFELVGNGVITNSNCGQYRTLYGCLNTDKHNMSLVAVGKNKAYVKSIRFSCNKPSCPTCYERWAVKEAGRAELRLFEAKKKHGQIEHLTVSIPPKDYGLDFETLRDKATRIAVDCGVVGGARVFHPFRYNRLRHWYWSPHFHILGFIRDGYNRCRRCKGADCYACDGFQGVIYRAYHDTKYIIEVFGERKTVGGTIVYELGHAGLRIGVKHFRVVTWFGVCSYRKLKISPVVKKAWASASKGTCPICGEDLIQIRYCGRKRLFTEVLVQGYKKGYLVDFEQDGFPAWAEVFSKYRGG